MSPRIDDWGAPVLPAETVDRTGPSDLDDSTPLEEYRRWQEWMERGS